MNTLPTKYRGITKKALAAAAGCGPLGVLSGAADMAAIAGIWGTYLYSAARMEQVEMSRETAVQICKTVLLGAAGYYAGCTMANRILVFIPCAGPLLGMGVSSLANVLFTYRFALTVSQVLSRGKANTKVMQLAGEIKSMFRGNGAVRDMKEIALLWAR